MRRIRLAATISALLMLTACGSDATDQATESPTEVEVGDDDTGIGAGGDAEDEAARIIGEAVSGDREGRAFDVDDDMVVQTIVTATDATKAEWDGSTLVASFDEGSAQEMLAGMPCSAIEAIIAADERAVLVYPDGEVDCETWR